MDAPTGFGVMGDPESAQDDIRVFYGFVDAVRSSVRVAPTGATQVRYSISCSGIQKAFDKTVVYFNQQLGPETLFGALLPGLANLMRGIALSGTPATIPRSIAVAYLGFGGQFQMPASYADRVAPEEERVRRVLDLAKRARFVEESLGFFFKLGQSGKQQKPGLAQRTIEQAKEQFEANSLAAAVDLFTYVKDYHVDGSVINTPMHDIQGSLWQLMVENSNPIMNECFLSLMPDRGNILGKKDGTDEWGIRPKYVPALIIREKPFSWMDGSAFFMDGKSSPYWTLSAPGRKKTSNRMEFEVPDVFFSSIKNPVKLPRLQQISPEILKLGEVQGLYINSVEDSLVSDKYFLDRVVIRNKDIVEESLGLSDNDHVNFFMMSLASIPISTAYQKFALLQDGLIPVYIPESIKKYGLRVREMSSKFMKTGGAKIDSSAALAFLVRSLLLQDMWYQHTPFYRAGTVTTRGLPKARIGMALDISDSSRQESFYIEGITHEWSLAGDGKGMLRTSLTVTRGQMGLGNPSLRFDYAPPDAVDIMVGKTPLTRPNVAKQPQIERSPTPDRASQVLLYSRLITENLGAGAGTLFAAIDKAAGGVEEKVTAALIKRTINQLAADNPTYFNKYGPELGKIVLDYEAGSKVRKMPPIFKVKEDRKMVGNSPWGQQPDLKGKMWDPVRRPEGKRFKIPKLGE